MPCRAWTVSCNPRRVRSGDETPGWGIGASVTRAHRVQPFLRDTGAFSAEQHRHTRPHTLTHHRRGASRIRIARVMQSTVVTMRVDEPRGERQSCCVNHGFARDGAPPAVMRSPTTRTSPRHDAPPRPSMMVAFRMHHFTAAPSEGVHTSSGVSPRAGLSIYRSVSAAGGRGAGSTNVPPDVAERRSGA